MADIETEGFEQAIASVDRLADNIEDGLASHVDDEVSRLERAIKSEITRQGLIDSGELLASFESIRDDKTSWRIGSTKDYASYLEFGTSEHEITPNKQSVLKWEPENPADFTDTDAALPGNRSGVYDPETGFVYTSVVKHPGNKEYNYIQNAQRAWGAGLTIGLRNTVRKEIVKSGFVLGGR